MTNNKTPIFPMPQPHHFTDYGFNPQIDYFQVLEEAMKHKRETSSRSIDALHFKLQKPISKDDSKKNRKNRKHKQKQQRWWNKNPLLSLSFFKWNRASHSDYNTRPTSSHSHSHSHSSSTTVHPIRPISGPLYFTDSRSSGSTTPYRTTSRPSSGPIAGTLAPSSKGDLDIPYVSLRELNVDQQHRSSTSALPIYMVT